MSSNYSEYYHISVHEFIDDNRIDIMRRIIEDMKSSNEQDLLNEYKNPGGIGYGFPDELIRDTAVSMIDENR